MSAGSSEHEMSRDVAGGLSLTRAIRPPANGSVGRVCNDRPMYALSDPP